MDFLRTLCETFSHGTVPATHIQHSRSLPGQLFEDTDSMDVDMPSYPEFDNSPGNISGPNAAMPVVSGYSPTTLCSSSGSTLAHLATDISPATSTSSLPEITSQLMYSLPSSSTHSLPSHRSDTMRHPIDLLTPRAPHVHRRSKATRHTVYSILSGAERASLKKSKKSKRSSERSLLEIGTHCSPSSTPSPKTPALSSDTTLVVDYSTGTSPTWTETTSPGPSGSQVFSPTPSSNTPSQPSSKGKSTGLTIKVPGKNSPAYVALLLENTSLQEKSEQDPELCCPDTDDEAIVETMVEVTTTTESSAEDSSSESGIVADDEEASPPRHRRSMHSRTTWVPFKRPERAQRLDDVVKRISGTSTGVRAKSALSTESSRRLKSERMGTRCPPTVRFVQELLIV